MADPVDNQEPQDGPWVDFDWAVPRPEGDPMLSAVGIFDDLVDPTVFFPLTSPPADHHASGSDKRATNGERDSDCALPMLDGPFAGDALSELTSQRPEMRFWSFNDDRTLPFDDLRSSPNWISGGFGEIARVLVPPLNQIQDGSWTECAVKRFRSKEDFLDEAWPTWLASKYPPITDNPHINLPQAAFHRRGSWFLCSPWAQAGDLRFFWSLNPTPAPERELPWALKQMMGIASALSLLHTSYGRHGDVKPENILVFGNAPVSEWTLKIADFGLANFHNGGRRERGCVRGYTASYCAPEVYQAPAQEWCHEITSAYDIFSLGCVFLEFTVWLQQGWDGIQRFERGRRRNGADARVKVEGFDGAFFELLINAQTGALKATLHPAVVKMTRVLHHDSKATEACHGLLEMILDGMLQIDPGDRFSAKSIADILTKLHQQCADDDNFATAPRPWRCFFGSESGLSNSQRLLSASLPNPELAMLDAEISAPIPEDWGPGPRSGTVTSTGPPEIPTQQSSTTRGSADGDPKEPSSRRAVDQDIQQPQSSEFGKRRASDTEGSSRRKVPRQDVGSLRPPGSGVHPARNRRLACPFFKHDPRKHGDRQTCCGPGWFQFHRVKEHLYRRHKNSKPGLGQGTRCDILSETQMSQLQRRFKGKTESEKWQDLYRSLFPEDATRFTPSPFYDDVGEGSSGLPSLDSAAPVGAVNTIDADFDDFVKGDISVPIRRRLASTVQQHLFSAAANNADLPDSELTSAILDCHRTLLESYRQSKSLDSTPCPSMPSLVVDAGTLSVGSDMGVVENSSGTCIENTIHGEIPLDVLFKENGFPDWDWTDAGSEGNGVAESESRNWREL